MSEYLTSICKFFYHDCKCVPQFSIKANSHLLLEVPLQLVKVGEEYLFLSLARPKSAHDPEMQLYADSDFSSINPHFKYFKSWHICPNTCTYEELVATTNNVCSNMLKSHDMKGRHKFLYIVTLLIVP